MISILALPLLASALAAVACGAVGTFCVARHNTYVAGALSHACFAGLGLAQYLAVAHGCAWATPTLGALSRAVLIALMFLGRVGALTMVYAALSGARAPSRCPLEDITVG